MTTYYPISNTLPQYHVAGAPASGYVLKAYAAGTSTPIQISDDYQGTTLVNTITLNASGYPAISGNEVIPHFSVNYKLALYPTQAAADANNGDVWSIDHIQVSSTVSEGALTAVASDATINLNSTATNYFSITGTTTITGITLSEGAEVTCVFADSLTITNGTYLLNVGGANIATAAGDIARFRGEAGGVVRMTDYSRASIGTSNGWVPIKTITANNDATIDFVNGASAVVLDGTYPAYALQMNGVVPATGSVQPWLRLGDSGGIDSGVSDYGWAIGSAGIGGGAYEYRQDSADAQMQLFHQDGIGSAAGEGFNGTLYIYRATSLLTLVNGLVVGSSSSATYVSTICGRRAAVIALDRLQFMFSSGNVESGTLTLYGLRSA